MTQPDYDLEDAYRLATPEEAARHYDRWSETYDDRFGQGWGYVAPREIARVYLSRSPGGRAPVLDVGAGTGLVARTLADEGGDAPVDGVDISPGMLARARAKGIYRDLIEADLTKPLPMPDAAYGGFVSCGTFTHGHVGPEALPELLRVARPGALFCLGTIPAVFDGTGLGSALARLSAAGEIGPLSFAEIAIYDGADHPHAADRGLVMIFERGGP